jgi:peptide/nickel transport system permease protein
MAVFIVRRLIVSFFVLLAATFLMYVLVANAGDPLEDLRQLQSQDRELRIAARVERLQLDVPLPQRYLGWLAGVAGCVLPGLECDLGLNRNGQEVVVLLGQALGATMKLVLTAAVVAILLGVAVGIVSALRQYSGFDYTITFASFLFFSLPVFWVAVLLKQYGAIELNSWLAEPRIPVPVIIGLALLSGLVWMAVVGGDRRRRATSFAVAAAVAAGLMAYLSAVQWFRFPALGFPLVLVLGLGIAVAVTVLVAGLQQRRVLYCSLAAGLLGAVVYFPIQPLLDVATWGTIAILLAVTVAVGLAIGYAGGGLDRRQAMRAATITAVLSAGTVFVDRVLSTFPSYNSRVAGRPVSTIGSSTPNFRGDLWHTFLDTQMHIILPTMALILISFAQYTRYTRASMLETMNQDYVRTARSKGLTERTVVMRHAFRNALIPVTTLMAFDFAGIVGGAVITEQVFGWQGMGTLFIQGLRDVDPNPVMAFFLVTGTAIVVFNMIADILYAYLDPRIRLS